VKIFSVDLKPSMTEKQHQTNFFVSARKLQEQMLQPYKFVLGLSPSEDVSSSSETKQDRRMLQRTKFFVLARILQS
jgi:hypothetical protein